MIEKFSIEYKLEYKLLENIRLIIQEVNNNILNNDKIYYFKLVYHNIDITNTNILSLTDSLWFLTSRGVSIKFIRKEGYFSKLISEYYLKIDSITNYTENYVKRFILDSILKI